MCQELVLGPQNDVFFVKKNPASENFLIMQISTISDGLKDIVQVFEHHCPILELQILDHDDQRCAAEGQPLLLGLIDSESNFIILGRQDEASKKLVI
jgi:hypothetical protein